MKNLSQSYQKLATYQDQLASGKKINRPSDDPVIAIKGIGYRTNLIEIEQFDRNLSEAYNWMESSDAALDHSNQILQRARELVVQLSNGTYSDSERKVAEKEFEQLKKDLIATANTKVSGKYIFNGQNTLAAPVDETGTTTADTGAVKIEVSKGIEIQVNINPNDVFNQGLFDMFSNLQADLVDPVSDESTISAYLDQMDQQMDNLLSARAELGARNNRFELIQDRLSNLKVNITRMISENEDAEIEEVITNLKTQESVHRAALSVGARIIQPTLMDFLR